jgi:hypothetical protein
MKSTTNKISVSVKQVSPKKISGYQKLMVAELAELLPPSPVFTNFDYFGAKLQEPFIDPFHESQHCTQNHFGNLPEV